MGGGQLLPCSADRAYLRCPIKKKSSHSLAGAPRNCVNAGGRTRNASKALAKGERYKLLYHTSSV